MYDLHVLYLAIGEEEVVAGLEQPGLEPVLEKTAVGPPLHLPVGVVRLRRVCTDEEDHGIDRRVHPREDINRPEQGIQTHPYDDGDDGDEEEVPPPEDAVLLPAGAPVPLLCGQKDRASPGNIVYRFETVPARDVASHTPQV